jgi:hypothetical protein
MTRNVDIEAAVASHDILRACAAYEQAIAGEPLDVELRIDAAFYYCMATDYGSAVLYSDAAPKFADYAWKRCRELLRMGLQVQPNSGEFEFWLRMCDWMSLSTPIEPEFCRAILARTHEFHDPAAFMFSTSQGQQMRLEARAAKRYYLSRTSPRCSYLLNFVRKA